MIALVDCNNFYAACERLFNPSLDGKPVVVLSNNDGCVIARSEEAKQLGIEMGAPIFLMTHLVEQHQVRVFSSNYALYGDMSRRVQSVLEMFSPLIETYSIDEAFLDLGATAGERLAQEARQIRQTVQQYTGIPVTLGVGPTKVLAKMASRYAKKALPQRGVYCLDTPSKIDGLLESTPIGEVWGIGSQHARRLQWMGIRTAADFVRRAGPAWVRSHMSVVGERILSELRGVPAIRWEGPRPKQAICTARSFGQLLRRQEDIAEALTTHAMSCAAKLRLQHSCAGTIRVLLQTNVHRTGDLQYARSIAMALPVATNNSRAIVGHALQALDRIYRPGYNFKKTGVIVTDLVPEDRVQGALFEAGQQPGDRPVMEAMDGINARFGRDTLRFAVQGTGRKWRLRQLQLSPRYTTDLDELWTIRI